MIFLSEISRLRLTPALEMTGGEILRDAQDDTQETLEMTGGEILRDAQDDTQETRRMRSFATLRMTRGRASCTYKSEQKVNKR